MKKIKAFFYVLSILFKGVLKNNNCINQKLYNLLKANFERNMEYQELNLAVIKTFPSGGKKILKKYNSYSSAKRFQTRMNYISHFIMDIESLEQNGVLRKYMKSMEMLNRQIEEEIEKRIEYLRKKINYLIVKKTKTFQKFKLSDSKNIIAGNSMHNKKFERDVLAHAPQLKRYAHLISGVMNKR